MSTILAVTFDNPNSFSNPEVRSGLSQSIPDLQQLPGILWKVWTYNEDEARGASFYLFDSLDNAKAWGEEALLQALDGLGASNVVVNYYEVDEEFSKATFATLERNPDTQVAAAN